LLNGLAVFCAGLASNAARGELPIDIGPAPGEDTTRPGIVVPAPLRAGTETNAPAQPAPPPTRPSADNNHNTGLRLCPAPRATNDWLRLQNQDLVPGRFLGWEAGAVRWEVADALRPVRFRESSVYRLVWAAPAEAAPGADRWVVRLTDGSLLTAQEARLEEKRVVAIGTVAGTLRLPREMVAALYRNPYLAGKRRILHNVEDWEVVVGNPDEGRMSYAEMFPPEPVLLEFDWPPADAGRTFQVRLPLRSIRDVHGGIHALLLFYNNNLAISQQVGQFEDDGVTVTRPRGAWPRVGVALHPGTGSVAVYVDGKLVGKQQADMPVGPVPWGISVQGVATDSLPFRALLLTPIHEEVSLPVAPGNADLIRMANGDAVVASLRAITATNFSLAGPQGVLELPVERFVGVVFATDGHAVPRRRENDAQLHFHDGGQLIAGLKEVTADQVTVESGALGRVTVPRASMHGLQLGPYRPTPRAINPSQGPGEMARPREVPSGTIGLRGGSLLSGQLLGVTPQTVMWQHPHALDPLEFALTIVQFANLAAAGALTNRQPVSVRVARPEGASWVDGGALTNRPPLPARVRLTNGDQLRGDLVGVDAQSVQLQPLLAAAVRIPRRQVAEVRPGEPGEGVWDAGSMGNWDAPSAPGPTPPLLYSRRLSLPPRVRLKMEVESRGKAGGLYVQSWLYCQDADFTRSKTYSGPLGYQLTLQTDRVTTSQFILTPDGNPSEESRASHRAPGLGQRPVSEITWLLDTVKGEAFVLVDGEQIGHMRDLLKTELGKKICIANLLSPFARLRDFLVTEWNGGTDFSAPPKGDAIRLHDFSLLAGPVEGVRDGMVYRAGQVPVPLTKVSAVLFDPTAAERVRRTAHDVRVTLWDDDELTLTNLQVTARGVTGTSDAWGEVTLPADAIRRFNFRPYDPPPATTPAVLRTSD
jgi:hypothetical protein